MQAGQRRRIAAAQLEGQLPAPRRFIDRHAFHIQRADFGQLRDQLHRDFPGRLAVDDRGDGRQWGKNLRHQCHHLTWLIDLITRRGQQVKLHRGAKTQGECALQPDRFALLRAARQ